MRRFMLVLTALVLLAGVVLVLFWARPEWRSRTRRTVQPPPGGQAAETEEEASSLPAPSLQIDTEDELQVYTGTPLVFSVRLANPQAMNAAAESSTKEAEGRAVEAAAAAGKIPKEKAERKLAVLRRPTTIRAVTVGDASTGWEQFVRFAQRLPDGKEQLLAWPLRPAAPPEAKTLTLDGQNTAQLDYLLDPAAAAQIGAGDYQIVALIEVPADANLADDRWRGRVESAPVKLRIAPKPERLAAAEAEKTNVQFARYYQEARDWAHALDSAQKALAANPASIPAHILVGEVKEAQGDLKGALAAYQSAESEFYRQYPNSYEAPLYLIGKVTSILEKQRAKP